MKKQSYRTLKNKLDKVFSEFIRRRGASKNGTNRCCSCGAVKPWRELQCGHFVSRVYLATRWDETNCHPQCSACNVLRRGNAIGYSAYLLDRYGTTIFDELETKSKQPTKLTRADLQRMIEETQRKIA